jgi:hypothetical protein
MMGEWQQIETAPKDGTWVLVGNAKYDHPFVCRWRVPSADDRWEAHWAQDNPGIWDDDMGYWPPTHWAPLLPLPSGDSP